MTYNLDGKSFQVHPVYDMYAASEDGNVIHVVRQVPLRGSKTQGGYLSVSVRNRNSSKQRTCGVHRFVWECYYGLIENDMAIDHINDIPDDKHLTNLSLVTHKQNCLKSAKNRNYSFAAKNHENRKYVRAVNRTNGMVSFFNSLYAVNQHLGINAGIVKMVCEGLDHHKTGTSKKDGCKYVFNYVTKEEFDHKRSAKV